MRYKVTFNASRENDQQARDSFNDYITAVRDGLDLADDYLGIYPEYEKDFIEFELKITDNLLELSNDKHFKFINMIQKALYEYKHLFICERIE